MPRGDKSKYTGKQERKADHIAIVRLEQLYPFAQGTVRDILLRYPLTAEVIWTQEEPRNMGAWRFLREQIQPLLDDSGREVRYVGRSESASPATGSHKRHLQEQAEILDEALGGKGKVRLVSRRKAK
jgi:2-oxoglutarate dehydrogenase E1 component